MKYPLLFLIFFLIAFSSCAATKDLESARSENEMLIGKIKSSEKQLADLKTSIKEKDLEITEAMQRNTLLSGEKTDCANDMAAIREAYGTYKAKLEKMTTEVKAAFPKNLDEPNFSIIEEDGRLVITLPNKILYKSGSAEFDDRALEIIQRLSKVFRNNQGLQILVEGHTDDIPLKSGSQYKDNWDLSLARSVKIVRQLETYGVFPSRLTAAGRGYFAPKSTLATEEARSLNRRTEIIIRPKISEFLKVIDSL